MGKYANVLKMYRFDLTEGKINEQLVEIRNKITPNKEKLKTLFSCLDLTSLNITDTTKHISELTEKINNFTHHFADIPQIAAFCFYPTFLETVKKELTAQHVAIATVVGFPNPLTFIEVRIAESALAASEGADEIDTVIPIQKILENNYDDAGEELEEIKHACRHAKLKVILETGALNNLQTIYNATLIAMYAGANFIKTSTGKFQPTATPEAVFAICQAIADYREKTKQKVGIKIAGGVATCYEAALYMDITEKILGKDYLNKDFFRIGASKLANLLLSEIQEKEINFF